MKVELSKIRVAHSGVSDNIYAGIVDTNDRTWIDKVDITSDFIGAVIKRWNGFKEVLESSDGKKYEISVKEIK